MENKDEKFTILDLETTGLDVSKDRILEMYFQQEDMDGKVLGEFHAFFNPGIPIPEGATKVNGLTNEKLANCKTFGELAQQIYNMISGTTLVGHNIWKYDLPLLMSEMRRCGVEIKEDFKVIDTQEVFRRAYNASLKNVYRIYEGIEMADAHSAKGDVSATAIVFHEQLKRKEVEKSGEAFMKDFLKVTKQADPEGKFRYDDKGNLLVNFGNKWRGTKVQDVEKGYFEWMLNAEFSPAVKDFMRREVMTKI